MLSWQVVIKKLVWSYFLSTLPSISSGYMTQHYLSRLIWTTTMSSKFFYKHCFMMSSNDNLKKKNRIWTSFDHITDPIFHYNAVKAKLGCPSVDWKISSTSYRPVRKPSIITWWIVHCWFTIILYLQFLTILLLFLSVCGFGLSTLVMYKQKSGFFLALTLESY